MAHHRDAPSTRRFVPMAVALACVVASAATNPAHAATPRAPEPLGLPLERPDDPPGIPALPSSRSTIASTITFGRFTSIQVNVSSGLNVVGDAANEPSIAVDPNDHDRMAIGWRQFDTITSNFRQAGFGYTTDGGLTWTAGKIQPGVFRSDPVLGFDAGGRFFYNSLSSSGGFATHVFPSTDGGATWGASAFAYGGDKQWMTVDRTGGMGSGQIYQAWSTASNPSAPNTFNRSTNGGASFQAPTFIPGSPVWGTLDVDAAGVLYVVGTNGPGGSTFVARSTNAMDPLSSPAFTTFTADLGGSLALGGPNPIGLLGQLWIAVDRSSGPRAGWIYVLASVETPTDPMDVHFIRSTDAGETWSTPVRVNDDAMGNGAWQWFGSMSVSPHGRIDVTWNDTRGSGDSNVSALYYAYSTDGGSNWSPNEQASPTWNSTVGWPNQAKIGDYYHMLSDAEGADLAYAATFNGEQDVYYLRIANSVTAVAAGPAGRVRLREVAPNPFSSSATIRYDVGAAGERVRLAMFDAGGRRVATLVDGWVAGGTRTARWSGADGAGRTLRAGVYFCRLEAGGWTEVRKVLLLR